MSVWDQQDPYGKGYFPEIAKTNANCVRIVWNSTANGMPTVIGQLDSLVKNCIANKMIPMIELHDATCNWDSLNFVVNYWTQPAMLDLIQRYEHALLLNVANEAGDDAVTVQEFLAGYKLAIMKLRQSGIRVPLIIDAKGCGKDLDVLVPTAAELIAHDPDHNVMFSVHPYWSDSAIAQVQSTFIKDQLKKVTDNNIPLILGELSAYGGWPGKDQPDTFSCTTPGTVDYKTILTEAAANNIGYLVWEWGPGNGYFNYDPPVLCPAMDLTTDGTYQSILEIVPGSKPKGWVRDVVIDGPFSIQKTAVKSNYILNGFSCQ